MTATTRTRIPFVDLVGLHAPFKSELMAVVEKAIDSAGFIGGAPVNAFEKQFAEFVGASACSLVNSGTDALRLALIAAGVGPDSVAYTVPNTFIATAESIVQAGATLRLVDVEPDTCLMSADALARALENHVPRAGVVDAIVPVHLYGQCVDMDPINRLAEEKGLVVIEDAAQAHGATYKGRQAGTLGLAAAFSFYPGKNLGALGEGGAVTSNDAALCGRVSMLRDHGQAAKAEHVYVGYNARLDAIQAGFLSVKLPKLAQWNAARQYLARRYDEGFAGDRRIRPVAIREYNVSSRHLYVVHVPERDRVMRAMEAQGIGVALHYPKPIHLQPCFRDLGLKEGSFPVAEMLADELLSLPLFPGMTDAQVDRVAAVLKDSLG
jgi:dTDP-4-amino-4,6-dideoxygalactose transaminase